MEAQAVIHFVGLVMFTTQLLGPNMTLRTTNAANVHTQSQVVAILPRVGRTAIPFPNQRAKQALTKSTPTESATPEVVEPHVAWIIFQDWTLINQHGWNVKPLSKDPAAANVFDYVELNGDQVSFVVDRPNPQATVPTALPHTGGTLKAEYAPPAPSADAAVFNIPVGDIKICQSQADGVAGRVDTELRLNNSGTITIRSGTKTLTLDTNGVVYVVNVPPAYAVWHDLNHTARNHYLIYCRMVGKDDSACSAEFLHTTEQCGTECGCSENAQLPPPPDGDSHTGTRKSAARGKYVPPPAPARLASFECSNTQYP